MFDCDGTLVDSQAAIGQSMEAAFNQAGVPYPGHEAVKKVVGLSLDRASQMLLPESHRHLAPEIEAHYRRTFADLRLNDKVVEPLYPKVLETLGALKDAGFVLGIATGKGRRGLEKTLASHGIGDFFHTLQTADTHPGKPDPSMLHQALAEAGAEAGAALFVGDTTFDIEMGRSAGIRTLGAAWGYHERAYLEAAGADAIIEGMDEVVHHALRL